MLTLVSDKGIGLPAARFGFVEEYQADQITESTLMTLAHCRAVISSTISMSRRGYEGCGSAKGLQTKSIELIEANL